MLDQLTAAKAGLLASPEEPRADLLRRLKFEGAVPREVGELFHQLRVAGNRATHAQAGDHGEALSTLKIARQLGIWFHRTFAQAGFSLRPRLLASVSLPVLDWLGLSIKLAFSLPATERQ